MRLLAAPIVKARREYTSPRRDCRCRVTSPVGFSSQRSLESSVECHPERSRSARIAYSTYRSQQVQPDIVVFVSTILAPKRDAALAVEGAPSLGQVDEGMRWLSECVGHVCEPRA